MGGQGVTGESHSREFVTVSVDGESREVHRGSYKTAELKAALSVDASFDLDIVEGGIFRTLKDDDRTVAREGLVFVSHARQGGSS